MHTPTLLTNLLYIHYVHMVWLSITKNDLSKMIAPLPMVHSYIYIYQSHDCCISSLVTILGDMYNLCKRHSLICMCSSCHSLSECTFLYNYRYKYRYETESNTETDMDETTYSYFN